jgi:hypothetical protein
MDPYYKPYLSEDSDSDSDSDTSGYTSEESLLNVPGKSKPVPRGGAAEVGETTVQKTPGTKFEEQESKNSSLFMINSRDRDTTAYPQPTFFSLRLPRVFKNVKMINMSQLNLLNSFFNFTSSGGNTFMYVQEQGRGPVKIQIRDGTYSADDLVTELTSALNSTPLFADISLSDFVQGFQTTGDYAPLFNTPGSVVYNSLTQTYQANQTIDDIISRYFKTNQNVGTVTYSYNQSLVGYYYAIIKEMIITGTPFNLLDLFATSTDAYDYIVFYFQGLNDEKILALASDPANQVLFDAYRYQNTFNLSLANKYTCNYNTKQGRLVINAPSLNDSISNDFTSQYNLYLTELVLNNGFTSVNDFQTQYSNINNANTALISFYNFIQTRFTSNFGINFGTYSAEFYANSNSEITLYNTLNRYGWSPTLTPSVSASTITSNVLPGQVPNLLSNIVIPTDLVEQESFISTTNQLTNLYFPTGGEATYGYFDIPFIIYPTTYNRITFTTQYRQNINIMTIPRYIDNRSTSTDIQYNLGYNTNQTPLLFDYRNNGSTLYNRLDISGNILFYMYEVTQTMFNTPDYMRAENKWITYMTPQILAGQRLQPDNANFGKNSPITDINISSYRPFIFFQLDAASYITFPQAHFNITFVVETQDGALFPVPIVLTWYKDRAGFMADVQGTLNGQFDSESERNYFQREVYSGNSAQMTIDVNNLQVTYFQVHIQEGSAVPSEIPLRVFAILTDVYGTYTTATRTDYFDLPFILGSLETQEETPASVAYQDPTKSIYTSSVTQLGYDISGVSNNLLDYTIQFGSNYYDPVAISDYISSTKNGLEYQFVLNNIGSPQPPPATTSWSVFFGSNSSNVIRNTYNATNNIYLSSLQKPKPFESGLQNEFTLVNWFKAGNPNNPEMYYTPHSTINGSTNYTEYIGQKSIFLPCINTSNLITDMSTVSNYEDNNGFAGMSFFLPPNQILKLDSLVLKFVYTQPSFDITSNIYTRAYTPLALTGQENTTALYRNQTTYTKVNYMSTGGVLTNDYADWDDWYLLNRQNIKVGVFETGKIVGLSTNSIQLSNALASLTLSQITQVNNYQYTFGTLRTREPDWGTYYKYTFNSNAQNIWDVANRPYVSSISSFRITKVDADFAPSFSAGQNTYTNYFLTNPDIYNYTYLPRSYGIAPAVANAIQNPTTISTVQSDIPNSYTIVPFMFDSATSTYQVGCFHGLSFTYKPSLPSTNLTGASPYYGPMGIFGWESKDGLFTQVTREPSTQAAYYWNTKLNYNALDLGYDPATDLTKFGGYPGISGEYQDTLLFMYENSLPNKDLEDVVSTSAYWVWGQEKNKNYSDYDDQSGYNNLSYIYEYTVRNSKTYATHVRGYDPIPKFTTGLRFIGKNFTDFGQLSFTELTQEISSLYGYKPISDISGSYYNNLLVNSNNSVAYNKIVSTNTYHRLNNGVGRFSHNYANSIINFDKTFSTTVTFGKTTSYEGSTFTFANFNEAITAYTVFFSSITNTLVVYNNVLSSATAALGIYVNTRYATILPSSIVNRNRITDPLPFSLLFSSYTLPPYSSEYDNWGLGYNLGFNKVDTPIRITATSDTFIRIVQSYIYLRLNPELNINTMAVSGKEMLAECRDSAAQEAKYFSKILLNSFGSYSSTAVQRPKEFNPVLGKYETITCQLTDKYGNQLSSIDCEYDFVLQIDEITNGPKDSSSLLGPTSDLDVYKTRS